MAYESIPVTPSTGVSAVDVVTDRVAGVGDIQVVKLDLGGDGLTAPLIGIDVDTGGGTEIALPMTLRFPASGGAVSAPGDAANGMDVDVTRLPNTVSQSVPMASASDQTNGRTSGDFTNSRSRGMLLLLDVTARNGTGALSAIAVQVKTVAGTYIEIFKFSGLAITSTGGRAFYAYPGAGALGSYKGSSNVPIGATMRIVTTAATDNAGNDLTYSIDVVLLP